MSDDIGFTQSGPRPDDPTYQDKLRDDHWRDTKVTVPCDGDHVLGAWLTNTNKPILHVVKHVGKGYWHDLNGVARAPDFWMPLPEVPE